MDVYLLNGNQQYMFRAVQKEARACFYNAMETFYILNPRKGTQMIGVIEFQVISNFG